MSIQDVGWVLEQDIPNASAKLVLVCIANHIHRKMDHCFPSMETIAEEASMAKRSVQRQIKWLKDENYLFVEEDFAPNARQKSNKYRLNYGREIALKAEGVKLSPSPEQGQNIGQEGGCQSVTLGGCQIVMGEGDTGDTPEGDNVVTPLTGRLTGIINPQTPRGQRVGAALAEFGEDWNNFKSAWRLTKTDSFEAARKAWLGLSAEQRQLAATHAAGFQEDATGHMRKLSARKYLSEHRWEGQMAKARQSKPKMVFVIKDSQAWEAWRAYQGGKPLIESIHRNEKGQPGGWAKSLFPPRKGADTKAG